MNEADVIQFLRSKASALNAAADALEGGSTARQPAAITARRDFSSQPVSLEQLVAIIAKRSARPGDLAKELGTSDDAIKALVLSPDSGLTMSERGWIKLSQEGSELL